MASNKLTSKQNAFAEDIGSGKYDYDWMAYEANYDIKKMSKNAIYVETCRLIQNPKVALRIKEVRDSIVKRNEVTIDQVLEQLANWLMFDPISIIDPDSEALLPLKDMDKNARMSLAEIHVQELFSQVPNASGKGTHQEKTGELKKIKFIDKRAVSEQFMKKFGQYIGEKTDLSSNLDAIREIIEAAKR